MSWIFLTDNEAWKLKKPVHYKHLNFSTPEARRRDCEEEVRLNRRLAPDAYLGVVPLTLQAGGVMRLGGAGCPIDWLVQMRRLPSERMLDQAIADGTWTENDIHKVGRLLARFYLGLPPIPMTGAQYRERLRDDLMTTQQELLRIRYHLPPGLVKAAISRGLRCIEQEAELLESRVLLGKIVEAHGDLRPEHICLEAEPVIMDCLEFSRDLRLLDPASELAFLALECERLGAPRVGELILDDYSDLTGDHPPARLLKFYKCYHASIRAKIAVWHLEDNQTKNPEKWVQRAVEYLRRHRD
jgi:aminoglycoside phosphotransferase family enzyme